MAVETARATASVARQSLLTSPFAMLAGALALVIVLMSFRIVVPVGPMYWDVLIYYDAANRIFTGQVPINDFFAPVGPLGYYLFAGWLAVFPNANPVLIAHWSLLAVTLPLMALVVLDIDRRSRVTAIALVIPFLIFALLPFNTREFYPFPGSDGFGIYNRQCCQLLYVLTAGLLFMRNQRLLGILVCAVMLALFFLKITGFVAALILCGYGFVSGRIGWRAALASGGTFLALLAALELNDSLISHYLRDILALVEKNSGTLLPRFLQATSQTFGIVAPASLLALFSLYEGSKRLGTALSDLASRPVPTRVPPVLDQLGFWLFVVMFAGIFFETQNTGSQALIFVWPAVLAILLRAGRLLASPRMLIACLALAGAATLPVAVNTIERAARTYFGALRNIELANDNLKTLGDLSMRGNVQERVDTMLGVYPEHEATFDDMVARHELPTPVLYSDFDFQIIHLIAIDRAIASIRKMETDKGIRFDTIMSLNFVNPFPYLMDREAPKHIAIGADPSRAVPEPDEKVAEAVAAADLVLYPRCPPTTANATLYRVYVPFLLKHRRIELNACFDAFIHPKFAGAIGP